MQTRTLVYRLFSACLTLLMLMLLLGFIALPAAAQTPTPLTRGDSLADAPSHSTLLDAVHEQALATGGTEVTVNTQTKKATFRVSDGWDLDQYLYMGSSPLDFNIDMNGYQAHPSDPSKVTLRVYDIDQQGAPGCGPEVDKVYVNGSYLGDLTGANNQWSIVTLSIPAGKLVTGSNHFQVLIDTTHSGCWEVEVDYAVVEIPFNIAQVEASAFDDVTIKRGKTDSVIPDPIWATSFTLNGDLMTPSPDDPIADKITGAREFKYKYKVATWPSGAQPIWTPKVKYAWEILGTDFRGSGESTAWEKDLSITLPDTVGKHTLKVALSIYQDSTLLRTDERMHTLYVLWDSPKNEMFSGVSTAQPRAAWLDYATTWASGQGMETDILQALVTGEYGNPRHWNYIDTLNSPVTLIENDNEDANCHVFRDVWRLLAASLGLSTGADTYDPNTDFMTSTRPALDNRYADARPVGSTIADRWRFVRHALGTYGGVYYDPTFGLVGTNRLENVFCVVDGYAPDGRLNCPVLIPPPARALLRWVPSDNPWGMHEYEIFATLSALQQAVTPNPATSGEAALIGNSTDSGYDMDGNGLFEHLRVDVQVNVTTAGDRGFVAYLVDSHGNLVTPGNLDPDLHRTSPATFATLDAGVHSVPLYFSGAAIKAAGRDGPYTVRIELTDDAGASLGSASYTTAAYSHKTFQGLLFEVQDITDSGVDTDALPGYNVLRVSVELNALAAGTAKIQDQLFAGETFLGDATQTIALAAGSHTISLDLPGEAISANGLDGPYTVYLSIADANYTEQREHTTAAYSHTAFQSPAAILTGASDMGIDSNANGLYEELDVVAEVSALVPGTYTVHSILQSSSGGFIQAGEGSVTLVAGAKDAVTLHFDGTEIYRHAVVGPFQVLLALVDSAGNKVAGLAHTTDAYALTAFEHPAATFNHAFADSGIDTDGDTLYNLLRTSVGVDVIEASTYRIEGSLQDNAGNLITTAHSEQYLAAGVQTVHLDFDGRAVNRQGVNGSYHVVGLSLTSGGSSQDYILDAHATPAYAYGSFQPAGMLLTGNWRDAGQDTNGNGLNDALVAEMEVLIAQQAYYYYNARLVDAHGDEITWASGSRYLYPGTQWVALGFDGRYIYGNAVDGPYHVKDLSIYRAGETFTALDLYTTHAYGWNEFERSGRVTGTVVAAGQPVPNANVFISGIHNDLSDSSGTYKLTVVDSGTYAINIKADPASSPWQIWVNGTRVADGTRASIVVTAGAVTEVSFFSTQGANQPPTADAGGPYTVTEGGQIILSGTGSDPDSDLLSYAWDLDNDGIFKTPGQNATFSVEGRDGPDTQIVVLQVCDDKAACATSNATVIIINAAPAVSNDRPAQSVQYSDAIASVAVSATDLTSDLPLSVSTTWTMDGGAAQTGLPKGLTLTPGDCAPHNGTATCTWVLEGRAMVAPGALVVTVAVSDHDEDAGSTHITITVEPEDARGTYTGALFASTSSATSNTAEVTLAATIQDITAVNPGPDPDLGDIRNATVAFVNRDTGAVVCAAPIGLVNLADTVSGTATCTWDVTITGDSQSFTIGIVVGGYYVRNVSADNIVMTVAKPLASSFISGGGHLLLSHPAGQKAGDDDAKNSLSFSVKYNKSGRNLGNINIILRRTELDGVLHTYHIKSNVMTSLSVKSANGTAVLNCNASIKDITGPLYPTSVDGNAILQVTMTDRGEPGTSDSIGITVWSKTGGLWFASKWDGARTVEDVLAGGNLIVR
jgi:Domain of unknown function (DUF4785) C-terminal domain